MNTKQEQTYQEKSFIEIKSNRIDEVLIEIPS